MLFISHLATLINYCEIDWSKAASREYIQYYNIVQKTRSVNIYKTRRIAWARRDLDKNSFESKSAVCPDNHFLTESNRVP